MQKYIFFMSGFTGCGCARDPRGVTDLVCLQLPIFRRNFYENIVHFAGHFALNILTNFAIHQRRNQLDAVPVK